MKATPLSIPDVLLLEPTVHIDERGFLYESFNQAQFERIIGEVVCFVQDNHTHSKQGVLRGLHYQTPPKAQGKLVRVLAGEIFDVAVDIRPHSATFGQWVSAILSADNRQQLWIPAGFAHGFLTLSASADVLYKMTDYYSEAHQRYMLWNDSQFNITWPLQSLPILSEKDNSRQ